MNYKERLNKAMHREAVDRPPCICPGGMMNMIVEDAMISGEAEWPAAHLDAQLMAKLTKQMHEGGGFENYGVPFCMTVEAEALGAPVFMGTRQTEPRVSDYIIESSSDWNKLKAMDVATGRVKTVLDAIEWLKDDNEKNGSGVPIVGNLTGPISLASSLVDPNVFYKEMRKKPEAVHELLLFVTEALILFGQKQIEAGADLITLSDPSGTGEILGAKQFEAFALPYLNKITRALKSAASMGVIVHICGRLKPIYAELQALESDVLSFDSITNVSQVLEHVEGKALMGNVSTYTLEFGETAGIEKMAKNCMDQGVHILSPACGVGAKTKLVNIQAMVRSAQGYGRT